MKRFGIILGFILIILFLIFFFSTSTVERISYFDEEYYKKTIIRLDSLKSAMTIVNDSIQAGFAKESITPYLNNPEDIYKEGKFIQVPMVGYGKNKLASGIHDSIFVKAVAVKVGPQIIVFVSADLLIMPPHIIDSVTILLSKNGLRREQLFYSATHSHSSIGGWGTGLGGEQYAGKQINVEKWLIGQISKAVISAIADLHPARIGSGCFEAETFTRNRLIGESGTKNNDFSFIALEQIGKKKAIIGSYAAHATTMGSSNSEISADYPGYWERKMEKTWADYAVFFAGSVGSQGPVAVGEGFDKPKFIGEALADSLNAHLPHVVLNRNVLFSSISIKILLPEYHFRLTTTINLTMALSKKLQPVPDNNVYLQAVRLGNMIWITTPSDFSGEYAFQLKNSLARNGFMANVTSFNGSYVGYIVPGRYFYLDEYEPKTLGWFGPNMGEYMMDLIRQLSRVISGTNKI